MSYQDPTVEYRSVDVSPEFEPVPPPADGFVDDDDEEWVNQAPKGLRIPPVMGILALVLFAVCGFWGGAVLQKHHDKSTRTTTAATALAGLGAGRRAAAGAAGGGGGGAGAGSGAGTGTGAGGAGAGAAAGRTFGTVSDIEGSTVYLTDAAGNIVKINLAPATAITKSTSGSVSDIQLGQTVIVSGAKGTDGSTTAATITISPAAATGGSAAGAGGTGAGGG